MADLTKQPKAAEGSGGFGKDKKEKTPEEVAAHEAWLAGRSKILWSSDVSVLKDNGPAYWASWKKFYHSFNQEEFDEFPEPAPMSDQELAGFMAANGLREWTKNDL